MKKGVEIIAICIVAMMVLTGCSLTKDSDGGKVNKQKGSYTEKVESSMGKVNSYFEVAQIGKRIFSFNQDDKTQLITYEQDKEEKVKIEMPRGYNILEITSGKDFFYVYCNVIKNSSNNYLLLYDEDGKYVDKFELAFLRVVAKDGMLYGYYNNNIGWDYTNMNSCQNCIEATHYIDETTFLESHPTEIEEWTKISGDGVVDIGGKKFYQYKADYDHDVDYYRDTKYYPVQSQANYVLYCDGKCSSAEDDEDIRDILDDIYNLMDKKEKNFVLRTYQEENQVYGVCNVYSKSDDMLQQSTKNIKYSITFKYDEKKNKFNRTEKYDKTELFYADDENLIYHKLDGAYYRNLVTGEDKKVYDYDGQLNLNVINGFVTFSESVFHYNGDSTYVFKTLKLW